MKYWSLFIFFLTLQLASLGQIHFQTDRQTYATGDTIWYSAQLPRHLSDSLTTLFIELVDAQHRIVVTQRRPVYFGQTHGGVCLSDTLLRGPYRIQSYTWSGESNSTLIWITKRGVTMTLAPPIDSILKVYFYPEGGNLVEGLPSRVVLKVQSLDGYGVKSSVQIIANGSNVITSTSTNEMGLGDFMLTPQPATNYTARITWKDSLVENFPLPMANAEGVVLTIDGQTNADFFRIKVFNKLPLANRTFKLAGFSGDSLCFSMVDSTAKNVVITQLPKSLFPKGIIRFGVFGVQNQLLAERWAMGYLPSIRLEASLSKNSYSVEDEVVVDLRLYDEMGQRVRGSGSISVLDSNQQMYFSSTSWKANFADIELITHPRYTSLTPAKGRGLWVVAQALDEKKRPVPYAHLLLLAPSTKQTYNVTTDSTGYFTIEGMTHEKDTLRWVIQQISSKNRPKQTTIRVIPPLKPIFDAPFPALMRKDNNTFSKDTTVQFQDGITLESVKVKAKRNIEREYYLADQTWDIDDKFLAQTNLTSGLQLLSYLRQTDTRFTRSRVPRNRGFTRAQAEPITSDPSGGTLRNVVIVIDGQVFPDVINRLMSLSAYNIQRIEVVRSFTKPITVFSGLPPVPGRDFVVAITTRMGPYGNKQFTYYQTVSTISVAGYTPVPVSKAGARLSGFAPTVHWQPALTFPSSVRFSTKSVPTKYLVLIRGLTEYQQYFENILSIESK